MFTGLSTLRKAEKKEPSTQNKALQDYLKRYTDAADEGKKKRKRKAKQGPSAVAILDHDISGLEPVTDGVAKPLKRDLLPSAAAGSDEGDDDDEPVIANPEEAEALRQQIEKSKNFYAEGADGSGWVAAGNNGADAGGSNGKQHRRRQPRQRHDSPGGSGGDLSPPRRQQRQASPDVSPPRRGRVRHDSPDAVPAAAAAAGQGGSQDLSPPRRRQRHDSPADASPPRRARQRHDSPADASPPRRARQRHDSPEPAAPRPGSSGARVMGDGTAAGLVSSKELAEEAARLRAQAEERKRRAAGRGEATVYRDKATGAVISAEEYAEQTAKARRKREPPEEVHVSWKGGLAQQRAAAEAAQRAAAEAGKAFGRGLDSEVDAELKERDRWGDPMAGKLRKRAKLGDGFDLPPPVITEANRAMMEASGFNIPQEVPQHSWLRRGVAAPVNRYGLRPGRHWDGVDRSTGFEKEMFKLMNTRAAREAEARMWAQEDM